VPHQLLIWTLLIVAPMTGVRVVCIDPPSAASATAHLDQSADCDEMCARPQKPARDGVYCALTADSCSLMLAATVAVIPTHSFVTLCPEPTPFESSFADLYLAPELARQSPPPRA
jgi:hypothetical protein